MTMATSTEKTRQVMNLGGLRVIELGKRVWGEVQEDNSLGYAAQLAYYFLFALFPFMIFLMTLVGYLPIPNLMEEIMGMLGRILPENALGLVRDNVHEVVSKQRGGLLSFGILLTLWSASSAVTAVTDAFNRAYEVREGRPFWKVRLIAIALTIGMALFITVSMVLLIFGPQIGMWVANQFGLGRVFEIGWNILRWPVIVILIIVATATLYYFAPDVEQEWRWLTPGSCIAVILIILTSLGFSYYVNNFGSYSKTYGSIGTVIVLMTWLYLCGFFLLLGVEINSEIEHAAAAGKEPGEKELKC
jgi:membrane protein